MVEIKLFELGERKIIELFLSNLEKCKGLVGLSDDAFAIEFEGNCLVGSIDMISQSRHIPREMTPEQIGSYAINASLSDIASMGAKPLGLLISLGLPKELDESFLKKLSKGISKACREHNTCILGGDTKDHKEIVVTACALGIVEKENLLTRSNAREGDLICVTGKIGSAPAGFYCLNFGINISKFIKHALEPRARVKEGILLSKYANACMDISDGLAYSLHEIAERSKKGFVIYKEKIPVDKEIYKVAELVDINPEEMILYRGGDYELLFTISEDNIKKIKGKIDITPIGRITANEKERKMITEKGEEILDSRSDEAFKTK